MNREYLLSICMMVKDEEKNLRRCLDALKPLLGKFDVELIIVDTGSHDKTIDIAKDYTDKVYYHQWNRNFSEMRNITISYAIGEYILIMDADEVLMDPLQLYSIITDEQFHTFNTYIMKVKNLVSSGNPTILPQPRVFRNDGQFHYEGAVHNQPVYKTPVLATEMYLEHYGYLFRDEEIRERKFIRTAGILKDELEKDPDNVYYRFQLARSYSAHREKKEALCEIRKAYRLVKGNRERMKQHSYIYGEYSSICCINNEFNEAVRVCMEGLEVQPEYIDLYYMLAFSYIQLGRKKEPLEAYKKYVDMVERFDELSISANSSIETLYAGASEMDHASFYIAKAAFDESNYDEAYEYLKRVHDVNSKMELLVQVLLKLKKLDELKETYLKYCKDKPVNEIIVVAIEAEREKYSPEAEKEIALLFSDGEGLYSLLNRKRLGEAGGNQLLADISVREADFNEMPDFYAELFTEIDQNTRPIISIFKKLKKSKIEQYIKKLINKRQELKAFFEAFLTGGNIRDDFQSLKVGISIAYVLLFNEAALLKNLKIEPSEVYVSLFRQYVEMGMKYTALLYDTERLRLFYSALEDQEDCFFIGIRFTMESIGRGEYKAGIRYFGEAARANPYMAGYMNRFADEIFPEPIVEKEQDVRIE